MLSDWSVVGWFAIVRTDERFLKWPEWTLGQDTSAVRKIPSESDLVMARTESAALIALDCRCGASAWYTSLESTAAWPSLKKLTVMSCVTVVMIFFLANLGLSWPLYCSSKLSRLIHVGHIPSWYGPGPGPRAYRDSGWKAAAPGPAREPENVTRLADPGPAAGSPGAAGIRVIIGRSERSPGRRVRNLSRRTNWHRLPVCVTCY
jgi:hypothetical protein